MTLNAWRFAAVVCAALTLGMGFAHVLEMPARMEWTQPLWVATTVEGGLYQMFGTLGAVIDIGAIVSLLVLTYLLRERDRSVFQLTALCTGLYILALALWGIVVFPVNMELVHWLNGDVPPDWDNFRARWEYGHAFNTILQAIGFAALVLSLLVEIPARQASAKAGTRRNSRRVTYGSRA